MAISGFERSLTDLQPKKTQPQSGKPGGLGGFLTSLLPTAGGTGGALAGAAGGAALGSIVPGVGTAIGGLLGAIAGGAGGSALGKVGENAIEGEQDLGKGVGEEALLGGLTSTPITGGFKLLKGAVKAPFVEGALKQGLKEAGGTAIPKMATGLREKAGAEIADTAESIAKPGILSRLQNAGVDMRRDVAGTSRVADSYTKELDLLGALERNGLKGSASNQYKNIDKSIGNLSNDIQNRLSTITTTVPRGDTVNSLKERVLADIPEDPTFTRELDRSLSRITKNAPENIDAKELFTVKQEVGNRLGNAFKKLERGGNLTPKEEVDLALWKHLDNEITSIAPEVKQATLDQSKLIAVRPALQKQAQKTAGVPLLGIKSKSLEKLMQSGRDITGRAVTGKGMLGRATADAAAKAPMASGQGILGAATRESVLGSRPDLLNAQPQEEVPGFNQDQPQETVDVFGDNAALTGQGEGQDIQAQLQAAALQALQAGDTKGLDNIIKVAGLIQSASPSKGKPMSAEAAKVTSNAQSGLDSLNQIEQALASDSGIQGRSAISSAFNPLGITGNILGTGGYEANRQNIIDTIARLRTGAAITNDEAKRFGQLIPQPADSPEVVSQKINMLRNQFQDVLARTGTAGNDTQSLLGQ